MLAQKPRFDPRLVQSSKAGRKSKFLKLGLVQSLKVGQRWKLGPQKKSTMKRVAQKR